MNPEASNNIVSEVLEDVLFIPVEAVHSQGDSITYVITRAGLSMVKQEVLLGKSNSDEVIILEGIEEGTTVYLSDPEGLEGELISRLESSAKALAKKD